MTRKRILRAGAVLLGLLVVAAVAIVLIARSQWFFEKVRLKLVSTVETATGGRVEIGAFRLDWKRLRAEVSQLVLHGTEPADKPPLLRASSVAVGLKIISVFKRQVDIEYLDAQQPQVYLIVNPDGSTNVPAPKLKKSEKNTVETILDLAIGRFNLQDGTFEVESRSKTPFSARGEHLAAKLDYSRIGPRYSGDIAIQPLDLRLPDLAPAPLGVNLAVVIERNRIGVTSGKVTTGDSSVDFSGALEDLQQPHAAIHYTLSVATADAARILKLKELRGGRAEATGDARWAGGDQFSAEGRVRAEHVEYRDSSVQLRELRLEGNFGAGAAGLELTGARVGGVYVAGERPAPANGQIARVTIRKNEIGLRGIALDAVGGHFSGDGTLTNLDRYVVTGELRDFNARRTVAIYSHSPLPWDANAAGTIRLEGSLRRKNELRASASLAMTPVADSAPVSGQVTAGYDAGTGILELGNSYLVLPHSRVEFSGALGRRLQAHFQTNDLNDLLPALGDDAAALPLKLENGRVVFDGTVTGPLDRPSLAGALQATNVSYSGNLVNSLQAQVAASPGNLRVQNAVAARGALRAQFQFSLGLQDWKTSDASQIAGDISLRNAAVTEVAAVTGQKDLGATGTLTATAKLTGTIGTPLIDGDLEITKGAYRQEPFDRLALHVNSTPDTIQASNGQLDAGSKQVKFSGAYRHTPGQFDTGRATVQIASNTIALEQVQTLRTSRPGLQGTAQVTATGEFELKPGADGKIDVRPVNLQADATARGLQITGQQFGNAHLTAQSQGNLLRAHLDSDFANSQVRADGQWRLEGDYPGEATLTFSKLDFAQLRAWISPPASAGTQAPFAGSAEGELHITGPALKLEAWQADLRLPTFVIGPALGSGAAADLTVRNQGPVVMHMANSVVTVENAKFTGTDTEISLTGKASIRDKNQLDLRATGRIGLGLMRDFDEDIVASGAVVMDATVRGDFASPQINGRLQLDKAAFNLADVPNGISNATGIILFNGDRATIQNLSGETGGGTIDLTGFLTYGGSDSVFRVHAEVKGVRVRYPAGVSTMADASITLLGTTTRSTLSGTVRVLRTGINLQSDFSSIIASSAAPLQTPSVKPGLLSGMKFDVDIETDPQIQFQSSLTEDLQVDASLHLRGTAANPALTGRANITQGQVVFFGTKFNIGQGSVSFYNPLKIEPILDIDLETKANGVEITLTVSGPINKLNFTPRSDPPMKSDEIVQLLATGRTPTTDPAALRQQTTSGQSLQQSGASTILGYAINSPVGRLQRLFGVSNLRIDPTIGGVENNPQARLTLEQQVTSNITLTTITNLSSSSPLVRLEWAINKQWSVVALREENGTFGLDFFFKKRF